MKTKLAYLTYLFVIIFVAFLLNGGKLVAGSGPKQATTPAQPVENNLNSIKNNFLNSQTPSNNLSWLDYHTVAHALGSIDQNRATNSLDAMAYNYTVNNMRLFETDLILTSDDKLINRHDWLAYLYDLLGQKSAKGKQSIPLSYEEFKNLKIHNKYDPLDFETLAKILKNHQDIFLITDTKYTKHEDIVKQFNILINIAKNTDESILDRMIIQVYNQEMYKDIMKIYPFKNVIYAIYTSWDSQDQIVQFCTDNNIRVVAIPTEKFTMQFVEKLARNNIKVYAHTLNTEEQISAYKAMGAWGVYSDYLTGL